MAKQYDAVRGPEIRLGKPPIGQPVDCCRIARAQRNTADPVWRTQQIHEAPVKAVRGLRIPTRRGDG